MGNAQTVQPLYDTSFLPGYVWAIIVVVGFTALFTGIYFAICGFTALRGWHGYAQQYGGNAEFPAGARVFSGESMMIGGNVMPANYRHVVTVALDDHGIYLRMGMFFKAFHAPISVPWDAVDSVEQKKAIEGHYTAVNVSGLPRLVFFRKLGDAAMAHWEENVQKSGQKKSISS